MFVLEKLNLKYHWYSTNLIEKVMQLYTAFWKVTSVYSVKNCMFFRPLTAWLPIAQSMCINNWAIGNYMHMPSIKQVIMAVLILGNTNLVVVLLTKIVSNCY